MRPQDREDSLYNEGKRVKMSFEENLISKMIEKNNKKGSKFLDIGCGSGEISKHYMDLGFDVKGIDFSEKAISLASRLGINADVMDVDSGLDFEDNSFDLILAGDVVEHVFDPIFMLKEVGRILKPQGSFYATIPNDLHL